MECSGLAPFCDNASTARHTSLQLVDNSNLVKLNFLLDYQFRGHRFDPQLLWCFGIGFKPRVHFLCVVGTLNLSLYTLLNLLHSERLKLYTILAFLSAIGLS